MPGRLIPAAGGVDLEQVQAAVTDAVATLPVLPDGGDTNALLSKASPETGDTFWVAPDAVAPAEKYRGGWAADELVYSEDFSAGVLPDGWVATNVTPTVVLISSLSAADPPAYSKALAIYGTSFANRDVTLDLSTLPEAEGVSLTRVTFDIAVDNGVWGTTNFTFLVGGNTAGSQGPGAWLAYDVPFSGTPTLTWRRSGTNNDGHGNVFLAGFRLYGQSDPYMLGDMVTWKGKNWSSTVDNNGSEPGTDAGWELLGNPQDVGWETLYATADRPVPDSGQLGLRIYDTDLGKPVWWNGTEWTDATGTAV